MKKILAFATCLLLAACDNTPRAVDGYTFEADKATLLQPERAVKVVAYPSPAELRRSFAEREGRVLGQDEDLQAFAVITRDTCFIHAVDPKVKYDPAFLGHELTHCLYGEFHPSQNERG